MNASYSELQPILEVSALKKYFPVRRGFFQRIESWVRAVDGVDLTVGSGQTLGLVGESGCGKSTVARVVLRLLEPQAGSIRFRGQEISGLSERELKPLRREMQIVFQDPYGSLNPRMTVGQSIGEGLRTTGIGSAGRRRERTAELLEMVGLSPDSADRFPHEFSGGQRQRVGIARALSVDPSLVICDEPISALDVSIQAQIINLLKDLQGRLGLSYLFISHDLNVVGYLCDRVAVMYAGRIMEEAPALKLFEDPRHPYTQKLLSAIPEPDPSRKTGPVEDSESAEMDESVPSGCPYRPACSRQDSTCHDLPDELSEVAPGHWVRCPKA
jgi:oligopeptide/dipeptide ABC transporter ATP-binding protein